MIILSFLWILFAGAPSYALYCPSLEQIAQQREDCEDNDKLSQAAESCVGIYRKKVTAEQAVLQKALSAQVADSGKAQQAHSENVNAGVLSSTISKLDQLIAEGNATRGELVGYIGGLLWPFVWSDEMGPKPPVNDPDLQKLLDEDYCYGEHKDIIEDSIRELDKMLSELKAAKATASGLGAQSRKLEKQLQAAPGQQRQNLQNKGVGAPQNGASSSASGKDAGKGSDVTGVEKAMKEEKSLTK